MLTKSLMNRLAAALVTFVGFIAAGRVVLTMIGSETIYAKGLISLTKHLTTR